LVGYVAVTAIGLGWQLPKTLEPSKFAEQNSLTTS
jgi:hypothetical protein